MPSERTKPALTAALIALVLSASACDQPPPEGGVDDAVESASQEIKTSGRVIDVGRGEKRLINTVCPHACVRWTTKPPPKPGAPRPKVCTEYGDDCAHPIQVTLHSNLGATSSDDPMGAWELPSNQPYVGCGIQAAQNVAHYFGCDIAWTSLIGKIRRHDWTDDSIASYPNELDEDLRKVLTAQCGGSYTVTRRNRTTPLYILINEALRRGDAVVGMVENGHHWQVINGWRFHDGENQYYVVDYAFGGRKTGEWKSEADRQFELTSWSLALSDVVAGRLEGFEDDTLIFVHRN